MLSTIDNITTSKGISHGFREGEKEGKSRRARWDDWVVLIIAIIA